MKEVKLKIILKVNDFQDFEPVFVISKMIFALTRYSWFLF